MKIVTNDVQFDTFVEKREESRIPVADVVAIRGRNQRQPQKGGTFVVN